MPVIARGLGSLQRFQRQLETVKSAAIPKVAERVGVALVKQVMDEFRESRDPYGNAWAPVQRNRRRDRAARNRRIARGLAVKADKPLLDTGRLRGSTGYSVRGAQVRVFLTANYASYHDQGTRRIKQRQILPSEGRLPAKWEKAIEKEAKRTLDEHFQGNR
jgi:phage gpG-like protein